MERTVFLFSGQGSQYFQMGAPLYQKNDCFRRSMKRMDAIVQDLTGCSVITTLYGEKSKADPFIDLELNSPAICMVELALADALMDAGVMPDLTLGSSLGAYAASVVSGFITREACLEMVVRQAQIIQRKCETGGMIAVLAHPRLFEEDVLRDNAVISATNFESHFVISARAAHLPNIETFLRANGSIFQRLLVNYPFHSPWIEEARPELLEAAATLLNFNAATVPMVCCVSSNNLTTLPTQYFWDVARQPIEFQKTIMQIEQQGSFRYIDLSPSSSLAVFLKYLLPSTSMSKAYSVMTAFGQDLRNFDELTTLCQ